MSPPHRRNFLNLPQVSIEDDWSFSTFATPWHNSVCSWFLNRKCWVLFPHPIYTTDKNVRRRWAGDEKCVKLVGYQRIDGRPIRKLVWDQKTENLWVTTIASTVHSLTKETSAENRWLDSFNIHRYISKRYVKEGATDISLPRVGEKGNHHVQTTSRQRHTKRLMGVCTGGVSIRIHIEEVHLSQGCWSKDSWPLTFFFFLLSYLDLRCTVLFLLHPFLFHVSPLSSFPHLLRLFWSIYIIRYIDLARRVGWVQ